MNSYLTLALLVVVFGVAQAKVDIEKAKRNFEKCQKETGAEETFLEVIKDRKIPSSPKGKCMMRCLMMARGIIDNFDIYDPVGSAAYFKDVYEDAPEKIAPAIRVAAKCSQLVPISEDKCDMAYKRIVCSKVEGDKENLQIKE